jgi:hypothetical protein
VITETSKEEAKARFGLWNHRKEGRKTDNNELIYCGLEDITGQQSTLLWNSSVVDCRIEFIRRSPM